jgi:hypothetical protein
VEIGTDAVQPREQIVDLASHTTGGQVVEWDLVEDGPDLRGERERLVELASGPAKEHLGVRGPGSFDFRAQCRQT